MPSGTVTYKNLFSLVADEIEERTQFNTLLTRERQLRRDLVSPLALSPGAAALVNVEVSDLIQAIQTLLVEALPQRIISGLSVSAATPPSATVTVTAGKGAVGGQLFELTADTSLTVPFDVQTAVFYVLLHLNHIAIEANAHPNKLTIAKIIVPQPGHTAFVVDEKDGTPNAYIINFREVNLYEDGNGNLEEDSVDFLRDNISPILADNLIGNIRLNEDLRITNTQGTIELDSRELRILDEQQRPLSKFNRYGVFLYNSNGVELAKFTGPEARIGNIQVLPNALQSANFVEGSTGFRLLDSGDVELNGLTVRGTIYATGGEIGGFTITPTKLYGGIIQTAEEVGVGDTGVVMDTDGLRGYDAVLGLVFDLPTDGSAPTFSSGIINETIFEISTNAVLRTSETVGDGTASSAGVLINNTGIYGVGPNQTLGTSNLKALVTGAVSLKGTITATAGSIGGVTITTEGLSGGLIEGSTVRGGTLETSNTTPRIRIDDTGLYYQITSAVGKYGTFKYGDGTKYGAGVSAYLFNNELPILAVMTERAFADIRLFNRGDVPGSGTGPHALGDFIVVGGRLQRCITSGSPGTFQGFTYRVGHTYAVGGEIKVASGDTDFINPFYVSLASGQSAVLAKCRYRINTSSSNATFKLQQNGGDITGYTGLTATDTSTETDATDVTLSDNDLLAVVVTAVSGTPKNFSVTIFLDITQ